MRSRAAAGLLVLSLLAVAGGLYLISATPTAGPGPRPMAVAGRFYPADGGRLQAAVEAFLEDAVPPRQERPVALVAPHAGYVFSGQIAADAFRQASGHDYDLVVILGTNHTQPPFRGVSFYPGDGYLTPLGLAPIDREATRALVAADPDFGFRPEVHREEHSVEVQVPFVQVALPGVKIVAAVVGDSDPDLCGRLGRALARVLAGRRPLIVASSDLSHYPGYEGSMAADRVTLTAVAAGDPAELPGTLAREMRKGISGLATCACGEGPILAAMTAARELGARYGRIVSHANSGDSAVGDPERVVGYGAVVFAPGPTWSDTMALRLPVPAAADVPLGDADKRTLLRLARETIRRYLATETVPLARDLSPVLCRRQGAFVTLEKHGQLRGCIGHMAEDRQLAQVVGAMALQAALNDRRFPALQPSELSQCEIEISVLTPFRPVSGPGAITIGRDGVLLRKGGRSAVFLPQVAPEQGWDREQMLDQLCRKAGLPAGSWREGAQLFTFQAEVFGESDLH